jgi:mRNA interferase MazF
MAAASKKEVTPRRGEVYLVGFDPSVGSEIRKTRPALVLQNDVANRYSPITIVAAITSKGEGRTYPTEVAIAPGEGGLAVGSVVLLNQIRSIDRRRLVRRLGAVKAPTMRAVDSSLRVSLGLVDV